MAKAKQGRVRAGDRELAAKAAARREAGRNPTARQAEALRRLAKADEDRERRRIYRSIPQKHWVEMSARQARTLKEQAARYEIPFGGKEIDLPAVVKALHDFLGRYGRPLAAAQRAGQHAGSIAHSNQRIKAAEAALVERRLALAAGEVVPLARHLAERMAILKWAKALAQRAAVELPAELIGKTTATQKRKAFEEYFKARFRELTQSTPKG